MEIQKKPEVWGLCLLSAPVKQLKEFKVLSK